MKKFENFCRALENLEIGANLPEPLNIAEETGIIALFEICFEQSWKVLKEILEMQGLNPERIASPKKIFDLAYSAGILSEEEIWIEILQTRNILIHTYDAEKSSETILKIRTEYVPAFKDLKAVILKDWLI